MSFPGVDVKEWLPANWHAVTIATTTSAICCAVILLLWTMPPRNIVMATGPEGGAYQEFGKQYKGALERSGELLRLVTSAGSVENLALLLDPRSGVNIA